MNNSLFLIGVLVASCGLFAYSRILQEAQSQLTPAQLAALASGPKPTWLQFFLPLSPLLLSYVLLPMFPSHQAEVAIPAMALAAVLLLLQYLASLRKLAQRDIPLSYIAARRKATFVLLATLLPGAALVLWAKFH